MTRLAAELASAGFRSAQLLVYADNLPARRLYERMGWQLGQARPSIHPRTGKPEVRYRLRLGNDHRPQS
jgi:ribosomal protein S18 acetylase RimI-like enzyme